MVTDFIMQKKGEYRMDYDFTDRIFALGDALKDSDFLAEIYASLMPVEALLQERFPRETPYSEEDGSTFAIIADDYIKATDEDDRSALFDALLEIIEQ